MYISYCTSKHGGSDVTVPGTILNRAGKEKCENVHTLHSTRRLLILVYNLLREVLPKDHCMKMYVRRFILFAAVLEALCAVALSNG